MAVFRRRPRPKMSHAYLGLCRLDTVATEQGPPQGHLVGVLQVTANWQSARKPRHVHAQRMQQSSQVHRSCFTLDRGIRTHDHFFDLDVLHAGEQLTHPELIGPNPFDWINAAMEHVVGPAELSGLLDRHDIARIFNHADQ